MFGIFQNLMFAIVANSGFLAAMIALASFVYTSKRQREIEKNSMYQQLELASIDCFRWESSNRSELSRIRQEYPNVSDEDEILLETYCTQVMNLFELCIHNETKRTLPGKVFGSWLPWIYEFANAPGFDKIWSEIKLNYIPECRKVIEYAIKNNERMFIIGICKKFHLKTNEWLEDESINVKENKNLSDNRDFPKPTGCWENLNTKVTIKNGKINNISKYLSIFDECKHDGYISHGEVLCGRATLDFKWADNIITQMKHEFIYYLFSRKYDVLEILLSDELTGFAIIELNKKTKIAILSDIMIKKSNQGRGIGKEALYKIEEYLLNKNIGIILLESGIKNEKAHDFFARNGYTKISIEFSKKIN
ncbi:MAG: GNAT family N-acetyltransferase [Treponema sp.]|jgi:GNAT superfamily N-acetyltransferase|nr:GNAT family N-acetyltransferase [Treponema sp.]